jgi:hypothetical protein
MLQPFFRLTLRASAAPKRPSSADPTAGSDEWF